MNDVQTIGPYQGTLDPGFDEASVLESLSAHAGSSSVQTIPLLRNGKTLNVSLKSFGRQVLLKNVADKHVGTRARRHWQTATHLREAGVGTPEPLGYLDRWEDGWLTESYFLAEHLEGTCSLKDELIRIYTEEPNCEILMHLLQQVADGVRALHAAGVWHRDLGNQNILLARDGKGAWERVNFIDLNRALVVPRVSHRQAAFDFSRLHLPSDFLRILAEMYFEGPRPGAFVRWERYYRWKFGWHTRSRKWRHPLRERQRAEEKDDQPGYPDVKDIWIWDELSGQATVTMISRDRRREHPLGDHLQVAGACLRAAPSVYSEYKDLKQSCFLKPVEMKGKVGMSLSPRPETFARERERLELLGKMPVWIRYYHHEKPADWAFTSECIQQLRSDGFPVSIALVQDRRAVLDNDRWALFVGEVLERVAGQVEHVEVGHAVNRSKWGVRKHQEYVDLAVAAFEKAAAYDHLQLIGPALIDFEYHRTLGLLDALPPSIRFHGLSHHLYVDRRGAPENLQGSYSTLEKCALARAISRYAPNMDERLIISEVNWPLMDTGIHSPVASPYLYPHQQASIAGVSEETYGHYMIRFVLQAVCSGMAERVYWWRLVSRGFGLVDDTDPAAWRVRPAYDMLKTFLELLGEATFTRFGVVRGGIYHFLFTRPDGEQVVLLHTRDEAETYQPSGSFASVLDACGHHVEAGGEITVSGAPLYLRNWTGT